MNSPFDTPRSTPAESSGARVSRNWITTASLVVIAICIGGATLSYARGILTPLLIAIFLYFLIQPLVEYLFQLRLPRWLVYALMIAVPLAFVQVTVWVIDVNVRAFATNLPTYRTKLQKTLDHIAPYIGLDPEPDPPPPGPAPEPPTDADPPETTGAAEAESAPAQATPPADLEDPPLDEYGRIDWEKYLGEYFELSGRHLIESAFGITLHVVEVSVLVVFYLLFMFLEARKVRGRVQAGFEPETAQRILGVMDKIDESVRRYLWIKTAVSFGLGLTTGLLGWFFGVDFWLLWGVLMFLANYITYVGSIAALVPPIALAYLQLSPLAATIVTVLWILNRLFWIDYAEIRYSGEHLDVSPLLLLLSIALLGWIWGVVGMLLAVPLVTSTKIVLSHFDNTRHIAKLMSDD